MATTCFAAISILSFCWLSTAIQYMPNVEVMRQRELNEQKEARCAMCTSVVEEIDQWLTGPLDKLLGGEFMSKCTNLVPSDAHKVCHSIQDLIEDELSELVAAEISPDKACTDAKMCQKGSTDARDSTSSKMPDSSKSFLCGLCKELTASAIQASSNVLNQAQKKGEHLCKSNLIPSNEKCLEMLHILIHDIIKKISSEPLSHDNMCIKALRVC